MSRIAIWLTPVEGPINASRKLAKDLRGRGHDVFFVGTPDCAALVASMGMPFVTVFERWFPRRRSDEADATAARRPPRGPDRAKVFYQAVLRGETTCFDAAIAWWKPDVLLVPSCFRSSTMCALLAHRLGVPAIYVTSIYLRFEDDTAGPLDSAHCPARTLASALAVRAQWMRAAAMWWGMQAAIRVRHGMNVHTLTNALADRCGYPRELIEWRDRFAPRLTAPEIVLYPACFDLPGGARPGRVYGSACIDLDRDEPGFPFEWLDPRMPLLLCAMGTQQYLRPDRFRAFLQSVIDAVPTIRPRHQCVVVTGPIDPAELRNVPDTVLLVRRAPQLALLRRAAVMITHGGCNSLKECAYFGVPVVMFPLGFDHPASAARVKFHGLGVIGSIRCATPDAIRGLVERAHAPYYRAQTAAMCRRLRAADETRAELDAIEAYLEAVASSIAWDSNHEPEPPLNVPPARRPQEGAPP